MHVTNPPNLSNRDSKWIETPDGRRLPGQRPPDRDSPLDRDPQTETPKTEIPLDRDLPGQRPPGQRFPQTETPLDRDPPGQRLPRTETSWTDIPPDRDPLDRDPPTETSHPREQNHRQVYKHYLAALPFLFVKDGFLGFNPNTALTLYPF